MKTIKLILTVTWFLFLQATFANTIQTEADWEEKLRVHLNSAIGNENFSFEKLHVTTSEKKLSGTGTFFGKSGVGFTVSYDSDNSIGFFEGVMPSNAKMSLTNDALVVLAGQNLKNAIPSGISKGIYLEKFNFYFSKEDKKEKKKGDDEEETERKVKQFNLVFSALKSWEIFSGANVKLDQIKINFQFDYPNLKEKRKTFVNLTGLTKVFGKTLDVTAKLNDKKEDLQLIAQTEKIALKNTLQSLVGKNSIKGFDIPDKLINFYLQDANLTFAPYQDWITINANSNFGKVDLWVKREKVKRKKKTSYLVTISPPKDFKFSKIDNSLKSLNAIDLSGQKIVISSEEKSKKETSKIPSMAQVSTAIKKGCSMVAKIDLTKLKVDHLIGVKNLIVSSPLTSKLDHMNLDANLDTDIKLGETSKLTGVIFRLKPSPNNFALSLLGVMDTRVNDDLLKFKGGVEIVLTDQTLNFLAMMQGDWHDPLGAKGLRVSDLGIKVGASFTTAPAILPNIALSGDIKIGNFTGDATVAFDTRNPAKSMLSVGFNKLVLYDFMEMIMSDNVKRKIPNGMKDALKNTYFKDVYIEVVPKAIQVLEKNYDAGFRAGGEMNVSGFQASGAFDISYNNGIMAQTFIDPMDFGIFKLEGAGNNPRPGFILELRKRKDKKFAANGAVSLLGLKAETDIHIKENGFEFMVAGKIFNLFRGEITASGGDIKKAEDMYLKVAMENNFFDFLQKDVSAFVQNSTKGGVSKLQGAYNNLSKAEKAVAGWDKKINAKKSEIKQKQSRKRAAYDAAARTFSSWQGKVNTLNREITSLQNAKKKAPWHKKAWYNTKIAAKYTAKKSATYSLNIAKKALDGLKWVNSDPDKDAQVIYLKGQRGISLGAVKSAMALVKTTQKGLGIGGGAAAWILKKGSAGKVVTVEKAEFEGKLGVLSNKAVKLKLQVKWLDKRQTLKVNFDFGDTTLSIANLSKELMKLK